MKKSFQNNKQQERSNDELFSGPGDHPSDGSTAQKMHMQVEHNLTTMAAAVDDESIPVF